MWESGSWVVAEALPDMLEAAAEKISVRRHRKRIAERRERNGVEKGGHGGQRIEADFLPMCNSMNSQTRIFSVAGERPPRFRSGASGIGMKLSMLKPGLRVNDCSGQLRERFDSPGGGVINARQSGHCGLGERAERECPGHRAAERGQDCSRRGRREACQRREFCRRERKPGVPPGPHQ